MYERREKYAVLHTHTKRTENHYITTHLFYGVFAKRPTEEKQRTMKPTVLTERICIQRKTTTLMMTAQATLK